MTRTERGHLPTEQQHPASERLDELTPLQLAGLFEQQNQEAVLAVAGVREAVAEAIERVTATFTRNGRLIYIGAGTSGRLGVLDASECPPTFGVPPWRVQGRIAGGYDALVRSQEGAEDSADDGAQEIVALAVDERDTVLGIASGSTTPYVHGAVAEARRRGAQTIFLTCNPPETVTADVDLIIAPVTGPEVVTGSTRLKAGTATKLVLNAITTGAMVRLGKTYGNLMVDLVRSCSKLEDRAVRLVCAATGVSAEEADALLLQADGRAKLAICMQLSGLARDAAEQLLADHHGHLREALADFGGREGH